MTIILDNYILPKTGHVELNLSFDIGISAEEAQRKVRWWLRDNVSMLADSDPPTLIVDDRPVWRVPVHIGFPNAGKFDNIGFVAVDVTTGEMLDLESTKSAIRNHLEKEVKPNMPPYQPKAPVSD